MTQIKNINAMQELTEVQEDMADTHDKFHNKSLKGKKGYITFARTKEGILATARRRTNGHAANQISGKPWKSLVWSIIVRGVRTAV